MEALINSFFSVKVDDYHVIKNDLQQLAIAYSNGELDSLSFPPLEEEYPYHLATNYSALTTIMRSYLPNESEVEIMTLVNYYMDLVEKTESY